MNPRIILHKSSLKLRKGLKCGKRMRFSGKVATGEKELQERSEQKEEGWDRFSFALVKDKI